MWEAKLNAGSLGEWTVSAQTMEALAKFVAEAGIRDEEDYGCLSLGLKTVAAYKAAAEQDMEDFNGLVSHWRDQYAAGEA